MNYYDVVRKLCLAISCGYSGIWIPWMIPVAPDLAPSILSTSRCLKGHQRTNGGIGIILKHAVVVASKKSRMKDLLLAELDQKIMQNLRPC